METVITLRMYSNEARDLIPANHKRISEDIVEATLSYEEARRLFQINVERRERKEESVLTGWFAVQNSFDPEQRSSATWFHVWVDRAFYQLAPPEEPIPACPLCGMAEGIDVCAVVPPHKFAASMAYATNNVWLLKPSLAARLAKEQWSGFVLAPVFTAKKRRLEYLKRFGLGDISTVLPLNSEVPEMLCPLLLENSDRADEADLWAIVPTNFRIEFAEDCLIGSNPAVPVTPKSKIPPCGHLIGYRLLGPLKVRWGSNVVGDLAMTRKATGQPQNGSLFRPVRKMIVSRRLAEVLFEPKIRGFDPQPLLS